MNKMRSQAYPPRQPLSHWPIELRHVWAGFPYICGDLTWMVAALIVFCLPVNIAYSRAAPAKEETAASQWVSSSADDFGARPSESCLQTGAQARSWTSSEHWAWRQLCQQEEIDFDDKAGEETEAGSQLENAPPDRVLRAGWIRDILQFSPFAAFTKNVAVTVVGAKISGTLELYDSDIASFRILASYVDGDVRLENMSTEKPIIIDRSTIKGTFELYYVRSGEVSVTKSTLRSVHISHLIGARLAFTDDTVDQESDEDGKLEISLSRLTDQLSIFNGNYQSIRLNEVKSDSLYVRPNTAKVIDVAAYDAQGMLVLSAEHWQPESKIRLEVIKTNHFRLLLKTFPESANFSAVNFEAADWGTDPLPTFKWLTDHSLHHSPLVAARLAKSYLDEGLTDVSVSMLYEEKTAERLSPQTGAWTKFVLYLQWAFVGYGLKPEKGFFWILGFVIIGAIVFRTNSQPLRSGVEPRSWVVFALDAVIPAIALDKEHEKVSFADWRQWVLYLLHLLGAVVVVLILEFLKNAIVGNG